MGVVAEKTRTREQTLGILLSSLYRTEGLHTRATQLSGPVRVSAATLRALAQGGVRGRVSQNFQL